MSAPRRILGIDPGSRVTGWAIIDANRNQLKARDCGVIAAGDGPFDQRLKIIFEGLIAIIGEQQPAEMAVEQVFVSRNAESALKLGQARGAAICAGVQAGLPVAEYAARRIKLAVVGTGRADKGQVQQMVRVLTAWQRELKPDAADAMAVAVCHAHESETARRLEHARGSA